MTVILRLQGLDATASAQDIRKFFVRLHIPDGGVYILGGSLREAFIAFSTERDAQHAMHSTGKFLKGSKVSLHISNMAELEHKLKLRLKKKSKSSQKQLLGTRPQPSASKSSPSLNAQHHNHKSGDLPSPWPLDPNAANLPQPFCPNEASPQTSPTQALDTNTAFLLGICTVLQGLQSNLNQKETLPTEDSKTPELTQNSSPGYIRVFGLPISATKDDLCDFFKGLSVKEVIMNVELGLGHGCLVQFATMQDACSAFHYNKQSLGSVCVEIRTATEKMWINALQECKNADHGERAKPCEETPCHMQKPTTVLQPKRQAVKQLPYKVPKKPRPESVSATSLPPMDLIVMVRNLSKMMTKTEIKELFGCQQIAQKNVLHLLDKEGNRTDTAFLIFNCTEDYEYAMNLNGCHLGSAVIEVSAITEEEMRYMLNKTHLGRTVKHQKVGVYKQTPKSFHIRSSNKAGCRRASIALC